MAGSKELRIQIKNVACSLATTSLQSSKYRWFELFGNFGKRIENHSYSTLQITATVTSSTEGLNAEFCFTETRCTCEFGNQGVDCDGKAERGDVYDHW